MKDNQEIAETKLSTKPIIVFRGTDRLQDYRFTKGIQYPTQDVIIKTGTASSSGKTTGVVCATPDLWVVKHYTDYNGYILILRLDQYVSYDVCRNLVFKSETGMYTESIHNFTETAVLECKPENIVGYVKLENGKAATLTLNPNFVPVLNEHKALKDLVSFQSKQEITLTAEHKQGLKLSGIEIPGVKEIVKECGIVENTLVRRPASPPSRREEYRRYPSPPRSQRPASPNLTIGSGNGWYSGHGYD